MSNSPPYIGITGFKALHEIHTIAESVNEYPLGYVMFGITSSNKRLLDPTSSGKTSPRLDRVRDMVRAVPNHHLPMIHYYTPNLDQLAEEVIALYDYCQIANRCGLQINALWPDPEQIKKLHLCYPDFVLKSLKITLQLPKKALEATNHEIVEKLKAYQGLINYVLIDPSGGMGEDFNTVRAALLMKMISEKIKDITPGVAGGFSAENVAERVKEIGEITACNCCSQPTLHDYCIDAQGKLRSERKIKSVFPVDALASTVTYLSTDKTRAYIKNSITALYS
jgi:hypothetical protein